jgi:hypothetical protein
MHSTDNLRKNLVKKIQSLPADKLKQVDALLNDIEKNVTSKETTLSLAGSWKKMDDEFLNSLTSELHNNRNNDREIL